MAMPSRLSLVIVEHDLYAAMTGGRRECDAGALGVFDDACRDGDQL